MPNVNRIPFIVDNGKVKYDGFRLMFGFPSNLREIAEKEILEAISDYEGPTDRYPIGEVKVVDNEYFRVEWDYPSKFDREGIEA